MQMLSVMLPGTAMPKPLQQALGLGKAEATQAAIAALPQHTLPELRLAQQSDPVIQEKGEPASQS